MSPDNGHSATSTLNLLILNFEVFQSCMKSPHGNEHIFSIIQNIAFDVHFRGGSRTAATSKMEHFVIIVNGWKPFTIITKSSILDVAAFLDPPLHLTMLDALSDIYTINNCLWFSKLLVRICLPYYTNCFSFGYTICFSFGIMENLQDFISIISIV